MATRSRIGVMHGDICKSVYCHYDGYIEHNGRILEQYYDSARANQLVALGDISVLNPMLEAPEGVEHDFDTPAKNVTIFYGRDRGEADVAWKVAHTFNDFLRQVEACYAEYYYIMKDGVWYVGCPYKDSRLVPLSEAIAELDARELEPAFA